MDKKIRRFTSSHNAVLKDAGKLVIFKNTNDATYTIRPYAIEPIPVGSYIYIKKKPYVKKSCTGDVTLTCTGDVTLTRSGVTFQGVLGDIDYKIDNDFYRCKYNVVLYHESTDIWLINGMLKV